MQSKIDERRTEKNEGLHSVMPWRTVKSSSQGWSKHSSSVNPRVSVLSSLTSHPFTHLYLCFSDEDKGKHSLIRSLPPSLPPQSPLPPFFFPWSLQARLAGLISNCDLTTWWKDWHACTNTHGTKYTHICIRIHTYVAKRRTRASFARSNYPQSKTQRQGGGWRRGSFAFSNVTHCSQDTHTRTLGKSVSDWRQKKNGRFSGACHCFFSANMLMQQSQGN